MAPDLLCCARLLLPFLAKSILKTSIPLFPGAALVCLKAGLTPAAPVVTSFFMLVVWLVTSSLTIPLYHFAAPLAINA